LGGKRLSHTAFAGLRIVVALLESMQQKFKKITTAARILQPKLSGFREDK
jgi:hypothetical protein